MREITSRLALSIKAALFVLLAMLSGGLLLARSEYGWTDGALLAICVWASCRTYSFAFYVLERYIDPSFRYSGLGSALAHLVRRKT